MRGCVCVFVCVVLVGSGSLLGYHNDKMSTQESQLENMLCCTVVSHIMPWNSVNRPKIVL